MTAGPFRSASLDIGSTPRVLPIACAINSDYALPLLVMLTSLKEYLRSGYRPLLYLAHQGVNDTLLGAISQLIEMCPLGPSPENVAAIPRHAHFPRVAAYPLLLPELLPETLDRILFLDADLLVLDDLAKLWEISIGERVLGAVPDGAIPLCGSPRGVTKRGELGIPDDALYFNCGVMLIRLDQWRRREVTRRAYGYLQNAGRQLDFLHQEALNAILWDDWLPLESRWNLLGSLAGRPYERSGSGWQDPGVVHFAGRFKPWRAPVGGPFYQEYSAFLARATQWVPAVKPTLRETLLSLYDRHLRNSLYACERALWNRRLL
jgi:lipopolysaccharide biosynthesis glycosyltransferase